MNVKALAPIVLMLHGGGWAHGSAQEEASAANGLTAMGFRTVLVDYPLNNPMAALSATKRTARRMRLEGRKVYAYGHSAGATIAAGLAARGDVDAAVIWEAPTNLLTWDAAGIVDWRALNMSRADRRQFSPAYRITKKCSPQLLLYGDIDDKVDLDQMRDYRNRLRAKKCDVRFRIMRGVGHWLNRKYNNFAHSWLKKRSYPYA